MCDSLFPRQPQWGKLKTIPRHLQEVLVEKKHMVGGDVSDLHSDGFTLKVETLRTPGGLVMYLYT